MSKDQELQGEKNHRQILQKIRKKWNLLGCYGFAFSNYDTIKGMKYSLWVEMQIVLDTFSC